MVSGSAAKAIADVSAVSVRRLCRGGGRFNFVVRTGVSIAAFLPFPLSPVITIVACSLVLSALYFFTCALALASCCYSRRFSCFASVN
jgi:hypothetical protein